MSDLVSKGEELLSAEEHLGWYMVMLSSCIAHNKRTTAVASGIAASSSTTASDVTRIVAETPIAHPAASMMHRFDELQNMQHRRPTPCSLASSSVLMIRDE